jgi:hypothetical protein
MKQAFLFLLSMLVVVCIHASPTPAKEIITNGNLIVQDETLPQIVNHNTAIAWEVNDTGNAIYVDQIPASNNMLFASLNSSGYAATENDAGNQGTELEESMSIAGFLKFYWAELLIGLMAFLKIVVNLTPTAKDNQVFSWIDSLFNLFIPNFKAGGGKYPS